MSTLQMQDVVFPISIDSIVAAIAAAGAFIVIAASSFHWGFKLVSFLSRRGAMDWLVMGSQRRPRPPRNQQGVSKPFSSGGSSGGQQGGGLTGGGNPIGGGGSPINLR